MTKPIGFGVLRRLVFEICAVSLPLDLQRLMCPPCSERVSPQLLGFPGLSPSCSHILTFFQIMRLFLLYSKNPLKDSNLRCSFVRDEQSVKSPTYPRSAASQLFNLNSPLHSCLHHCYISSAHSSTFWCCQGIGKNLFLIRCLKHLLHC